MLPDRRPALRWQCQCARHSSPADLSRELATAFSCSRPLPAGGVQVMGTSGRINCSHQAAGQFLIFAGCDPVKVAACNNTNEVRTGARERATRPRRLRPLLIGPRPRMVAGGCFARWRLRSSRFYFWAEWNWPCVAGAMVIRQVSFSKHGSTETQSISKTKNSASAFSRLRWRGARLP